MWKQNNGIGESNTLQNEFTSYLAIALQRKKTQYLASKWGLHKREFSVDIQDFIDEFVVDIDMLSGLPINEQIEDDRLVEILHKEPPRNVYILLSITLDDQSLIEIARELEIPYQTVASIHYRLIKKIRARLGGDKK